MRNNVYRKLFKSEFFATAILHVGTKSSRKTLNFLKISNYCKFEENRDNHQQSPCKKVNNSTKIEQEQKTLIPVSL